MKRPLSPSSCEDDYSEDGYCAVTGSTEMHNGGTRKRRRGAIEKRRRDRINQSLNELKKLVPTALEKSGSAKLEKAEILQMTVDHLKMLQRRGVNGYDYDPHRYAMDYHSIGFRECAAEVARYLTSVEGMNTQDPMRVRLVSHLQMFASSRAVMHNSYQSHSMGSWTPTSTAYIPNGYGMESTPERHDVSLDGGYFTPSPIRSTSVSSTAVSTSTSTMANSQHYHYSSQSQFPFTQSYPSNSNVNSTSSKPYRPWGTEMAC